ncbi:hypothetical protein G6F66_014757 [Rhizopus arrhizus]|nr:hypothetical protein G6F66_014757 [Rhizopus arrhizus]
MLMCFISAFRSCRGRAQLPCLYFAFSSCSSGCAGSSPKRFSVAISQPVRCQSCTTLSTAAMVSASPLRVHTTELAGSPSVAMGAW